MSLMRYRKVVLGRILLSALTYGFTFLMASMIGAEGYGTIAFYIFLVKNIPLFTLGLTQGLIYKEVSSGDNSVKTYSFAYFILAVIIFTFYGFVYDFPLILLSVPLFFVHVVEPFLKAKKDFLAILYVELICVFSLFLTWFWFKEIDSFGASLTIFVLSLILVFVFFVSRLKLVLSFIHAFMSSSLSLIQIKELLSRGVGSYFFNVTYFSFLLIDRSFVEKFYTPQEFGSVMLAFQLAMVAGFIPVAMNSRALVDLGEEMKSGDVVDLPYLVKRLSLMLIINISFVFGVLITYYFLGDWFFKDYEKVEYYILIFGLSIALFNGYGSISPILFYLHKQKIPGFFIAVSVLTMTAFHVMTKASEISLVMVETISFSILSFAVLLCLIYTFYIVRNRA